MRKHFRVFALVKLVGDQVFAAYRAAEVGVEPGLQRPDRQQLAILGLVHIIVWRAAREEADPARRDLTVGEIPREKLYDQVHHAIHHRRIDELPPSGLLTGKQRGQHAEGTLHPTAGVVGEQVLRDRWQAILGADERERASLGDVVQIMPGEGGIGSGLAIAGDRAIDQTRVQRFEGVVINAQAFGYAWTQLFDQDISLTRQLVEDLARLRIFEVNTDALLVALEGVIGRGATGASHLGARSTGLFSAAAGGRARLLHSDHLGSHITENHGAKRPGGESGKVKDSNSCERSWHAQFLLASGLGQK